MGGRGLKDRNISPGEFPRDEAFANPSRACNQQCARAVVIGLPVREPVIYFTSQHIRLSGNQFSTKKQVYHTLFLTEKQADCS